VIRRIAATLSDPQDWPDAELVLRNFDVEPNERGFNESLYEMVSQALTWRAGDEQLFQLDVYLHSSEPNRVPSTVASA
jgi:hypothetical protein